MEVGGKVGEDRHRHPHCLQSCEGWHHVVIEPVKAPGMLPAQHLFHKVVPMGPGLGKDRTPPVVELSRISALALGVISLSQDVGDQFMVKTARIMVEGRQTGAGQKVLKRCSLVKAEERAAYIKDDPVIAKAGVGHRHVIKATPSPDGSTDRVCRLQLQPAGDLTRWRRALEHRVGSARAATQSRCAWWG